MIKYLIAIMLLWVNIATAQICTEVITADDNGITLQAALNNAGDNDTICMPSGDGVVVSNSIVIPGNVNFLQYSPLIFSGTGVAITIGSTISQPFNRIYRLWVRKAVQSNWSDEGNIGVKLVNINTSDIHIVEVNGFTIGVQYMADEQCTCYNQTKLLLLLNNKYSIDVTQQHGGAPNGNIFYGGRFTHNTGIGVGQSRYGVRFNSLDLTYTSANENKFYGPSFELGKDQAGSSDAVPVLMLHGQSNLFHAARSEGNGAYFADVQNDSMLNQFDVLFLGGTSQLIVKSSTNNSGDSLITGGSQLKMHQQATVDLWASGPFHKTWVYNGGVGNVSIPGVAIGISNTHVESIQGNLIIPTSTYVEVPISRSLVRYVSTNSLKRFVIFTDTEASFGGRIWIRAYDALGNILTSSDSLYPHVVGLSGAGFTWSNSYGGSYVTGSDTNNPRYFSVKSNVKSVAILITGGSLPLRIRGFRIAALDTGHAATWSNFDR